METILFLAHTEQGGTLAKAHLEALHAAKALSRQLGDAALCAGLVGAAVQPAADQTAACGAARHLAVAGPEFGHSRYATDAVAVAALCRQSQASLVLAAGTARWNRVLPGAAHRLGARVDKHVTGVTVENGQVRVTRWYYRQRMEAELARTHRPWIIVLDPASQPAWSGEPGNAKVVQVDVELGGSPSRTAVVGIREPAAQAQTIRPDADLLFVTGAGWTKKQADGLTHVSEAEQLILEFIRHTRASLGSSKSLVDLSGEGQAVLSCLTHLNQIGQTGSTPRHPKGLATCCHGEEPHTVGWRFITERRAVNLDPNCGWARGKADVLYVADAFAVTKKMNEILSRRQSR